jgi:hypothetical protein
MKPCPDCERDDVPFQAGRTICKACSKARLKRRRDEHLSVPKIRLYGGPHNGKVVLNIIPTGPNVEIDGDTYEVRTTEFGWEGHFLFG